MHRFNTTMKTTTTALTCLLLALLSTTELYAYERQLSLPEVFQGDWYFDMGAGTVTFSKAGEQLEVSVQILGMKEAIQPVLDACE